MKWFVLWIMVIAISSCAHSKISNKDRNMCRELATMPMCKLGGMVTIYEDLPDGRMKFLWNCNCVTGEIQ